jgi:hypothetical protein
MSQYVTTNLELNCNMAVIPINNFLNDSFLRKRTIAKGHVIILARPKPQSHCSVEE